VGDQQEGQEEYERPKWGERLRTEGEWNEI
jgi:hypothetical protein